MMRSFVIGCTICCTIMILAYKDITRFMPIEVRGVVVAADSRKAIAGLHVFTCKGEEEGFTDKDGRFSFKSWQHLPLVLTLRQPNGESRTVQITSTPVQLTIVLP